MIGDRVEHFEGKGTDLSALQSHVEGYLRGDGFTVQTSAPSAQGTVIQASTGPGERRVTRAGRCA